MLSLFRNQKPDLRAPVVRRVRDLEILSARLIRAGFAGDYHSAFHGRGIEFAQVREYQPGDDIRTIDWNVTARSGVPHVKQFVEERDLTVLIAVDVSGSMSFGSVDWRKSDIAAELTSIFAFSAVENADRVGLLLFSDRVQSYIPPRRGHAHAQVVVHTAVRSAQRPLPLAGEGGAKRRVWVDPHPPSGHLLPQSGEGPARSLHSAANYLERISAKRAVVILISDFLDLDFEKPLKRLNRKHDVIAVSITDPREERFPAPGLARVIDAETGQSRLVDLARAEVGKQATYRRIQLERRFRASGIDWLGINTAVPYDRDLLRFFRERMARR